MAFALVSCAASPPPPADPGLTAVVTPDPPEPAPSRGAESTPEPEPRSQAALPARGWLGVELSATEPTQAGVLIRAVVPGSPAAGAGVLPGDVLLRVDGKPMNAPEDVIQAVGSQVAGSRVSLALKRGQQDRMLAAELVARPDDDEVQRMTYVGAPAPAFESLAPAQGAVKPTLQALRGKVVVVEFWSPWCVVCRLLVPTMNEWHGRYSAQGAEVIGITTESVVGAAQAARQLGISHPVLSDETGKTTLAYRAMALPTVFVIDRAGTVRDVMVGYYSERIQEIEALIERLVAEP